MATFNPLAMILTQEPMDGNNYHQWKLNLDIVLEYEKIKFVLTTPKPQEPVASMSEPIHTAYSEWQKANIIARYYILTSVASHLQEQISTLESGAEIIQILDGMFGKPNNSARQSAIEALMYTRMTGESVRDHCLTMMSHISRAEMMGVKLEQEVQTDFILISLSESFNQFKMNYNMNMLNMTPIQLMHELESAEKFLVKPSNVHLVESSVKPKGKPKGKNKNKKRRQWYQLRNQL